MCSRIRRHVRSSRSCSCLWTGATAGGPMGCVRRGPAARGGQDPRRRPRPRTRRHRVWAGTPRLPTAVSVRALPVSPAACPGASAQAPCGAAPRADVEDAPEPRRVPLLEHGGHRCWPRIVASTRGSRSPAGAGPRNRRPPFSLPPRRAGGAARPAAAPRPPPRDGERSGGRRERAGFVALVASSYAPPWRGTAPRPAAGRPTAPRAPRALPARNGRNSPRQQPAAPRPCSAPRPAWNARGRAP
jgi:hypothetical protein